MAEVISARIGDDLMSQIDHARGEASRGAWLTDLINRELGSETRDQAVTTASSRTLGPAVPSPGHLCMWANCFSRDTDRYGGTDPGELHRQDYRDQARSEDAAGHVLCKRHAAQLEGRAYTRPVRDVPPAWRRQQVSAERVPE